MLQDFAIRASLSCQAAAGDDGRGVVAGARHRGQHGDLLRLRTPAAAAPAGAGAGTDRQRHLARSQSPARDRRATAAALTQSSATRCSAISSGSKSARFSLAGHRDFGANLAFKGQTSEAEGLLVSGQLLLCARPDSGARPSARARRRSRSGRASRRRVESQLLDALASAPTPAVLDDTLVVNGEPMTIVGVAPEGFSGTTTMDRPQVFVPLTMAQQAFRDPKWNGLTARNNHWLYVFGRLQPGVTREQAEALLKVPFTALIREVEFPALRSGMGDRDRRGVPAATDPAAGRRSRAKLRPRARRRPSCCSCLRSRASCWRLPAPTWRTSCWRASPIARRRSQSVSRSARRPRRLLRLLLVEACVLGVAREASARSSSRA